MAWHEYEERKKLLVDKLKEAKGDVGLSKSTSNLFRQRKGASTRINVRDFNHVLSVDAENLTADVEGMTTYEEFVRGTLRYGLLPTVVPELKSITVGGAATGVGIESSSFKYGLVHETIEEMEILLGNGTTVVCNREKNKDLFYGFANSYGTLGYALRLKVKLIRAKKYVRLEHTKFTDIKKYFAAVEKACGAGRDDGRYDYIDGMILSNTEMYLTTGTFVDQAPYSSNYRYMRIYYKSIRNRREDFMSAEQYIWRWDTDWFWCSKNVYAQNPLIRVFATPLLLNSKVYQRLMRASHKAPLKWFLPERKKESVIQDVDIPIEHAPQFLDFFLQALPIRPIWMCPVQSYDMSVTYDLYAIDPLKLYINFGFWDVIPTTYEDGYYNKLVEKKVLKLGGKKGLYSTSYYDEETFWKIYNKKKYDLLKKKYDPASRFKNLYEKTVKRS
jgi:FAD/FMN-containing dehydrogenase